VIVANAKNIEVNFVHIQNNEETKFNETEISELRS
jgi:hypothetical protein